VASSSTRQRKLAKAKLDRQLARRADKERRQRQIRAAIAGVIVVAVAVLGGFWLGGAFNKKPAPVAAPDDCTWTQQDVAANQNLKDVGVPGKTGIPKTGTSTMTVAMKLGETDGILSVQLDRSLAKCGTAALTYLADRAYYSGTKCHSLTHAEGSFALRCGDHSGTGNGGANFTWYPENVPSQPLGSPTPPADPSASPSASASPTPATVLYHRGDVAMVASTNGSQFLIFYKDSTVTSEKYSIVGHVTDGLSFVDKVAENGTVADANGVDVKPKTDVTIQSMTVVETPQTPQATSTPAATATPTATASAQPSS
jgi:peptidyl-prolyl cis-trans isomerase B (cyclophilin B)